MEGSRRDLDSTWCSANILVTELDKCYREDGATVMLEMSSSGEWLLVVKKNGLTRYTHKAEKSHGKEDCNYDMDSDDEEWLKKFNSDFFAENELHDHVSEDNFELMVDRLRRHFIVDRMISLMRMQLLIFVWIWGGGK
ncbi:hypothetical protein GBA52_029110 [Prunus armeniaca]|nr:hypothetical protein GBA52_029110 [Prunus armeniaca]